MIHTKNEILKVIKDELEDREITRGECGGDQEYIDALNVEIEGLKGLYKTVENEAKLRFEEYMWLSDLISTATEYEVEEYHLYKK